MVLWIAHDGDPPAVTLHHLPLRHGLRGVVGPLAVNVGLEGQEEIVHRVLGEDHHPVDRVKRGHQQGAILLVLERPVLALELLHRGVGVDAHDQEVALGPGALEIAGVADVEEIEAAVREGDGLLLPAAPRRRPP